MQLFQRAPTTEELVAFIDTQHTPLKTGDIAEHFGIDRTGHAGGKAYEALRYLLRQLAADGQIALKAAGRYSPKFYHSVPRLVEEVQNEQVVRFNVGLQPPAPAITLDDLKAKAKACSKRMHELQDEIDKAQQQIQNQSARLDVLLSLIEPFDETFRLGLH